MIRVGADLCDPVAAPRAEFSEIKAAAHERGLAFLRGENRVAQSERRRQPPAAGAEGAPGLRPSRSNLNRLAFGQSAGVHGREEALDTGTPSAPKTTEQPDRP